MSLDLSKLRISNDTLSDEEVTELKAKRRQIQDQLEVIASNKQPDGNSKPLQGSHVKKKDLVAQLSTYNALLAPHKLLPSELLSQIFIAAFPTSTFIPIQVRSSPLVLCQVCSRWRSVAVVTPELWTDVILRLSKYAAPHLSPQGAIDVAVEWFKRSETSQKSTISLVLLNQLPVTQSVVTTPADSDSEDDTPPFNAEFQAEKVSDVLQLALDRLVVPFAHRFRSLQLGLPAPLMVRFVKHTTAAFPELRRLSLSLKQGSHIQNWTRAGINVKPVTAFGRTASPLLTDLELVGFHHVLFTQILDIAWASVTRLNLSSTIKLTHGPCYRLLRKCRLLEECTLEIDLSSNAPSTANSPPSLVHLPHLHSLTVEFVETHHGGANPTQPEQFFEQLLTPALKTLVVNWPGRQTFEGGSFAKDVDTCQFLTFLKRSDCALEVFQSDLPDSEIAIEHIALAMPSLVEFRIRDANEACGFTQSLLSKVKDGKALPRLKVLSTSTSSLPKVLDMLEGRWSVAHSDGVLVDSEPVSCPEYIMVEHQDPLNQVLGSRIDALRDKGVDIHTTKIDPPGWDQLFY